MPRRSGTHLRDCELRLVDITRHDDPAEELPEQVKGDLRARGHVIRRDSQLDRELKKLPLSHAEEVEAWLRQMLARLGARDAGYEARYVIINEAANWMDKKLLAPLLEANGRDPGHSGPAGHLRSLLFDAKVDGELLRPERLALYQEYAQDRNDIKHNPGCEASTAVALGWLGMIGNRLVHDCCDTDEAMRERVRACLESGTASVVEPTAPEGYAWAQYSVVAWHAIKHDELSSTCTPAALVQHLASVLEDRLVPYAKLRSRQDIRDLFDKKQLGNDGGWTSLLKGVLAPLADLNGVLQLVAKMGLYLQDDHIPWLRLVCSSRPGINSVERYFSPGVFHCIEIADIVSEDSAKQDLVDYVEEEGVGGIPNMYLARFESEFPRADDCFASLRPTFEVILAAMRPLTVSTLHQVGDTLRRSAGGYGCRKANGHTLLGAWMLCGMEATPEVVAGDKETLDLSRTVTPWYCPGDDYISHDPVQRLHETFVHLVGSHIHGQPCTAQLRAGHAEVVKLLLQGVEGGPAADISCTDWEGSTALHYAALEGRTEVVKLLLRGMEGGPAVDISFEEQQGQQSPALRSFWRTYGGGGAAAAGVEGGPAADISCSDSRGMTALHTAAETGGADLVKLLLRGVEGGPAADISCKDESGMTALHWAAQNEQCGDISCADKDGMTALHYAFQEGNMEVVKLLVRGVEGGPTADIFWKDKNGMTALHCAAQEGHAAVVALLLRGVEGGPAADISCAAKDGMTALHYAFQGGDMEVVKLLLRGDEDAMTALHYAALNGHAEVVELLLRGVEGGLRQTSPAQIRNGRTALHWAAHGGSPLLLRGVEGGPAADISCADEVGWTALHCAAQWGHAAVVELLLRGVEGGPVADMSCKDKDWQDSPALGSHGGSPVRTQMLFSAPGRNMALKTIRERDMHRAAWEGPQWGHAGVVELLLGGAEGGPAADICCADEYGRTALHWAALKGHTKVVALLLRGAEGGPAADLSCRDKQGRTALHCAALNGPCRGGGAAAAGRGGLSCGRHLLQTKRDMTALHYAAQGGHAAVVELLLRGVEGGPAADISCTNESGMTALHCAALRGHTGVVELLLRGVEGSPAADISCKDKLGRPALHCAAFWRPYGGSWSCCCGAWRAALRQTSPAKDESGGTALHWAASGGHMEGGGAAAAGRRGRP
eukprot:jgi/Tetstr1/446264/TSEL_033808.t1